MDEEKAVFEQLTLSDFKKSSSAALKSKHTVRSAPSCRKCTFWTI